MTQYYEFNINDFVHVELTDLGKEIVFNYWKDASDLETMDEVL